MHTHKEIIISKEDIVPYIYFVCSMAQRGRMYGGLSGKSDYMGGIFDRWINIIPESVIFNKYFLPKISNHLSVISDYYEYNPKKSGIAPDVLGIQVGSHAKPFVEYKNRWCILDNAPQIEVKSFKKSQYMVSLRNQGYDNKYLVMVETNLDSDYLLPFFEKAVISDDVYNKLKMDDAVFIKSNLDKDLSSVTRVIRQDDNLGTLKLIAVCSAKDFMTYSTICEGLESPFYVKEITETRSPKYTPPTKPLGSLLTKTNCGLYDWNGNILDTNHKRKLLSIYVDNIQEIGVIKNSKSSVTISTKNEAIINDVLLEPNKTYIIKFQLLDRSSNRSKEYFMNKSIVDRIPSREIEMVDEIRRYIK
jgi:hypothetical protein